MPVVDELIGLLGFRIQGEGNLAKFKQGMDSAEQGVRRTGAAVQTQDRRLGKLEERYNSVAAASARWIGGVAVGMGVKDTIGEAIKIEKAMVDVQRAFDVDASGMKDIKSEIFAMSGELGKIPTNIAAVYTAGGKAGIAREAIKDYTRDVLEYSTAWDVAEEKTANSVGTISTIFRMDRGAMRATAGAINSIADGLAGPVNEGGILEFLERTGAAARGLGLSAKDTAAFGGAFASVGIQVERASTAFASGLVPLLDDASKGNKDQKTALKHMGFPDLEQFSKDIKSGGFEAVIKFLQKLNSLPDKSSVANDLFGLNHKDEILTLASAIEQLVKARDLAANDPKNIVSLEQTRALKAGTTDAQIEKARANISIAQDRMANAYLPSINAGLGQMNELLKEGGGLFEGIASGAKDTMEAAKAAAALMDRYKKEKEAGSSQPFFTAAAGAVAESVMSGLKTGPKQALADRADEVRKAQGVGWFARKWAFGGNFEADAKLVAEQDAVTRRAAPALAPWLPIGSNVPQPAPASRVASAFEAFPQPAVAGPAQPAAGGKVDTSAIENAKRMLEQIDGTSAMAKIIADVSSFLDPANQALGLLRDFSTTTTAKLTVDISEVRSGVAEAKALVDSVGNLKVGSGSTGSGLRPARVVGAGAAP